MAIYAICRLEHYDGRSHTKVGEKRTDIGFGHSHAFCYDFYQSEEPIVRPVQKVEAPAPAEPPKAADTAAKKGKGTSTVDL